MPTPEHYDVVVLGSGESGKYIACLLDRGVPAINLKARCLREDKVVLPFDQVKK